MTDHLVLPGNAQQALCDSVAEYGHLGVETGGLLMCPPDTDNVGVVALAGHAGVTRQYGLFVLTMPVIDQAFTFAEDMGLQIRCQVHSHAGRAALSPLDQRGNLRINGFLAAVIPTFADPPQQPSSWGWWTFRGGSWRATAPASTDPNSTAKILTIDADGIRDH
ncbi:MAG: hypothetical protein JO082_14355 [Mycobacterium sp.]|nr:hypothetical protein [Mycobacterium sp.]MBV9723083.1 hypothetical protein [Mycobacterium sp.]